MVKPFWDDPFIRVIPLFLSAHDTRYRRARTAEKYYPRKYKKRVRLLTKCTRRYIIGKVLKRAIVTKPKEYDEWLADRFQTKLEIIKLATEMFLTQGYAESSTKKMAMELDICQTRVIGYAEEFPLE